MGSRETLWLPVAIYRVIGDVEGGPTHRNLLYGTFTDFEPELIDSIVDSLIAYGAVVETGATERAHGELAVTALEGA
jgi:hypothetical protein